MGRPPGRPNRISQTRAADTRANDRREIPASRHVGKLYVPLEEIPPGMAYSWVAVEQMQVPDYTRADEQSAKGWTPVPRDRHSRFRNGGSLIPGRAQSDPYAAYIKVGGLLLCERPKDDVETEKMMKRVANENQVGSVSRWRGGEGADPLMPRFDESSNPKHGYAAVKAAIKDD